jgi:N-acetylglucosamine kinase-like BadF-type ATPase
MASSIAGPSCRPITSSISIPFSKSTSSSRSSKLRKTKMSQRHWPPRLYLAVDCGGTKAAAAISDEHGRVIGKGRGGPANYTDEGLQSFLLNVEDAITSALDDVKRHFTEQAKNGIIWHLSETSKEEENAQAHTSSRMDNELDASIRSRVAIISALRSIKPSQINVHAPDAAFRGAWFGIAGVDSPADVTTLSPQIAKMLNLPYPSPRLIVANDTSLLASPITDSSRPDIQSGVVAISGTGSIVMSFKRSKSGMLKVLGRVGGLGWVLGDEGSGYSVGRDAVRKVLEIADRERLHEERDDLESDSEEESDDDSRSHRSQGDSFVDAVERDMDLSADLSKSSLTDESLRSTRRSSSPTTETSEDPSLQKTDEEPRYGQMLRDRMLQDWGLSSTDELLRAVYNDHAPPSSTMTANFSKDFPGVPTIIRSGSLSSPTAAEEDDSAPTSPIAPSLSSSPSDSSSTATRPAFPAQIPHSFRSDSASQTEVSSVASSFTSPSPTPTSDRKHRLASLAPLVFHLAFTRSDRLCLEILRSQAHLIALQIRDILQPKSRAKAHLSSKKSVLCLGGGLVGQNGYRSLLIEELEKLDIVFALNEYVADPATRGAIALSRVMEQRSI